MAEIPFDDEGHLIEVLDFLGDELEPSILIGGWATVRRVGGEISRDIDLIIASDSVRQKIESTLSELSRSTHLQGTKWRGTFDGVHVDVYIPHQSQLGDVLRLRVEELAKHTETLEGSRWQLLTSRGSHDLEVRGSARPARHGKGLQGRPRDRAATRGGSRRTHSLPGARRCYRGQPSRAAQPRRHRLRPHRTSRETDEAAAEAPPAGATRMAEGDRKDGAGHGPSTAAPHLMSGRGGASVIRR